ncbi:MAG: polysaccharide deacetylase family protein [Desulfobulbaceae bacterium]|nr:polysaccharide deacetylase family protein [Desulfobulbaceae bacterium]HIJ79302.1 polysaccharide deacetylase family protein [Deltaproteobacteria bacterium]
MAWLKFKKTYRSPCRLGIAVFFLIFLLSGCVVTQQTKDFVVTSAGLGDTSASLAARYLGDSSYGPIIEEFNQTSLFWPGRQLVVPLNLNRGGLYKDGYQVVPVLVYHGFTRDQSSKKMFVRQQDFEQQMRFLQDQGYTVVSLDRLYDFIELKKPLPAKSVVITIDDGWCSLYEIAYPILKRYGYPATVFLYTDFISKEKCLNWQQLREMAENGVDIQSHTRSHQNLNGPNETESFSRYFSSVRKEIEEAEQTIETKLGDRPRFLAYPYGAYNDLVIAYLQKRGYRGGVTVTRAANPFFVDPFKVNRSVIYGHYSLNDFKRNLVVFQRRDL